MKAEVVNTKQRLSVGLFTALLCALAVLGPALGRGFVLSYDMVFVPRLAFSARTLGVDGAVPRAVPNDAVVAFLSVFLPGWLVQTLLLLLVFLLLGIGLSLLLRSVPGVIVATVFASWNPWIAQRLEVGHWGFVLGYALLPLLAWAAIRVRSEARDRYSVLGFVLIAISLTGSTGAVLALLVLMGVLLCDGQRMWKPFAFGFTIVVLVSATWWWPFLRISSQVADSSGVTAFASSADTPWGVLGSLLSGGGIWNQAAWYTERQSWVFSAVAALLVVGSLISLFRLSDVGTGKRGLLTAAVVGFVLAALSSMPVGRELITFVVTHLPGGGLLRDSQKFLAPWIIAASVGLGMFLDWLASLPSARDRGLHRLVLVLGVCVPALLLPSLAWGSQGSWRSVNYPVAMTKLANEINAAEPGGVAVFPWIQYRRYAWNQNRIVLDPWNRLLARDVVVNDGLPLKETWVAGEDPRAAEITALLSTQEFLTSGLRSLGIRHVLILTDQPNADISGARLAGAKLRGVESGIEWWDLGTIEPRSDPVAVSDYLGWLLALSALLWVVALRFVPTREENI